MNPKKLVMFATEIFDRLSAAGWIPALLMRVFVGYFFMETGWGKIHNLNAFTTRFAQWGIPHPAFNAALSAYTEFGVKEVAPFIALVAILTVKLKNVGGLDDFVELDEPLYALSFVWLFFSGAGWLSVDGLFKRALNFWIRPERSQATVGALSTRCAEARYDANGLRDF